jgi:hypothetical protein
MSDVQQVLEHYVKAVQFPEVSGFEVLELLDMRSRLAVREGELDAAQRAQLEDADDVFLRHAPLFYESVAALGDLNELRHRAGAACSHWWWYLEKLAQRELIQI